MYMYFMSFLFLIEGVETRFTVFFSVLHNYIVCLFYE